MTRRRFVRLVMAEGIQRNLAEALAERIILMDGSWERAYGRFEMVKGHLPDLSIRAEDILRYSAEKIGAAVKKLGEAFRQIALTIRPLAGQREAEDEDPRD